MHHTFNAVKITVEFTLKYWFKVGLHILSCYIYNVCDHQECYKEVGSQAISYTTGVPAMIGAMLVMNGTWQKPGVYNIEEFDPDPFLDALDKYGLPRSENRNPVLVD